MKSFDEIHDMIATAQVGDGDRLLDICQALLEHLKAQNETDSETGERVLIIAGKAIIDSDLRLISQQGHQIALHLYDHSIANAPLSPEYARQTADVIGKNLAAIQEAVERMRSVSAKLVEKQS